jgi:hypothetical protein
MKKGNTVNNFSNRVLDFMSVVTVFLLFIGMMF